jgi:hypothetical protein
MQTVNWPSERERERFQDERSFFVKSPHSAGSSSEPRAKWSHLMLR